MLLYRSSNSEVHNIEGRLQFRITNYVFYKELGERSPWTPSPGQDKNMGSTYSVDIHDKKLFTIYAGQCGMV